MKSFLCSPHSCCKFTQTFSPLGRFSWHWAFSCQALAHLGTEYDIHKSNFKYESREREAKQKDQQRKKKKLNTKLLSFGEDDVEGDARENGDAHATRVKSLFEADVDDPRSEFRLDI